MSIEEIYTAKASEIIRDSIKTAVYIDEKAWDPFSHEVYNTEINEHVISKNLLDQFKKDGIKLNIHKFNSGEEDNPSIHPLKRYLFGNTNLVILDWDLDDNPKSQNYSSLKLLADIIAQPNIHFCSIYSSADDFDQIIKKVCSYFSGASSEQYKQIRPLIEPYDDAVKLLKAIDITKDAHSGIIGDLNKIDSSILREASQIIKKKYQDLLIDLKIAIDDYLPKAETPINYFKEIISNIGNEYTLLINNTFVTILQKTKNAPEEFVAKFSSHISQDKEKSYFKLLGLDMQREFLQKGAFINPEILNINLNSFLDHRRKIKEKYDHEHFNFHIKDIFLKNAELNLSDANLSFLDSSFLDSIDDRSEASADQLALINSFYNGAYFLKENRLLNFGDIFSNDGAYYLCITALCDCITYVVDGKETSNVDFKYYFVKGSKLPDINDGFSKGDGGFISYIDDKTCISWTQGEYIKPFQLYIPKPLINDEILVAYDWAREPHEFSLEYKFTLKQNYAQRIANHAFSHPMRVGIDFLKISK